MEEFNSMNQKSLYLLCLLSTDISLIPAASVFVCFSTGRGSTDHKTLKEFPPSLTLAPNLSPIFLHTLTKQ